MSELLLKKLFDTTVTIATPSGYDTSGQPETSNEETADAFFPENQKRVTGEAGEGEIKTKFIIIEKSASLSANSRVTLDGETYRVDHYEEVKDNHNNRSHWEVWLI